MPDLTIILPYGLRVNSGDVDASKRWTLRRADNGALLVVHIDEILVAYSSELVKIAERYHCKAEDWQWSQNKELQREVLALMGQMEDELMALIEDYSLNVTDDDEHRRILLPFFLRLSSKGTDGFRETLDKRVKQFLYDLEAQVAAMKLAGYGLAKTLERVRSTLHAVYASPEVLSAFNKRSKARFLISRGVHPGNQGLSSSGAVNVENLGRQTAAIVWLKDQLLTFADRGAAGYYQLRGSSYPCDLCDSEVGLHQGDWMDDPYPHAHCMCYRVPVFNI